MRKRLLSWLSLILPIVIIVGIVVHTWRKNPEALRTLVDGPNSSVRLVGGLLLIVVASSLSFLRWHLLMRTLHLPIRLRDTLRLGFLGQCLNFVAPGQFGGDLFKAVFVARENPGRRVEAVGTIIVDRVCGLYGLLLVASGAFLMSSLDEVSSMVGGIAKATFGFTAVGTVCAILVLIPAVARGRIVRRLTHLPKIGPAFARILDSVYLYQNSKLQLAAIGLMSLGVHILIALAIYLAATGVYVNTPPMADLFVISPIAAVAAAVPLTPGGLGSYEVAMTYMYNLVSPADEQGRGIVVAFAYRLGTILVAAIGIVFYWLHHREVMQVMHEVEEYQSHSEETPDAPSQTSESLDSVADRSL